MTYALAYRLGYRLPGFDRHPSWQEFPQLAGARLVAVQIPDFARRYGARFRLPEHALRLDGGYRFDDYYRANLRNVRSLGFQQTSNEWT